MFEKEAEEYANEYGQDAFTQFNMPQWIKPIRMERKLGFQKGAELAYNKANEWHYVKDGIFPTHSKGVLVFTDEGVGLGIYGLDNKKWYTYDTGFEVIAWKEIVLPELKESE